MFRIVKTARAWRPVVWNSFAENGEVVENRIEMLFQIKKIDELAEFMVEDERDKIAAQVASALSPEEQKSASVLSAELVKLLAVNWRGVELEEVGEVPFDDVHLRMLVNEPNVMDAIIAAWRDAIRGGNETLSGN